MKEDSNINPHLYAFMCLVGWTIGFCIGQKLTK